MREVVVDISKSMVPDKDTHESTGSLMNGLCFWPMQGVWGGK